VIRDRGFWSSGLYHVELHSAVQCALDSVDA
jgi:hypothetical protein